MKIILKVLVGILGAVATILVTAQIALSPSVATRLVNRYAPEFLDADLSFGKVGVSIFRHFPKVTLSLEDALLTYPHDRFDREENAFASSWLMRLGRGAEVDTLASFDNFSASVNVAAALAGKIRISNVELVHPRIFAKMYNDTTANWNIFKVADKEKDTTSTGMPAIRVGRLHLADEPVISLCVPEDTLFALLYLNDLSFKGKFMTDKVLKSDGRFSVDSLLVAGKFGADTLHFGLEHLGLNGDRSDLDLDIKAELGSASDRFGRVRIPIAAQACASFPEDSVFTADIARMNLSVAGLPLEAKGHIAKFYDRWSVDADASVDNFHLGKMLDEYGRLLGEEFKDVSTNAVINLKASAKGDYRPGNDSIPAVLPSVKAELSIPSSRISYAPVKDDVHIALDASLDAPSGEAANARVGRLNVKCDAVTLDATASADDLLGEDPLFGLDATVKANAEKLLAYFPNLDIDATGVVDAGVSGKIHSSQLNMKRFANANLSGFLGSGHIDVTLPSSGISALADAVDIKFGTTGNTDDGSMKKGERLLVLNMTVDSLHANVRDSTFASVRSLSIDAHNSAEILKNMDDRTTVYPFEGVLGIKRLSLRTTGGVTAAIRGSKEKFTVRHKDNDHGVPVLSLKADNELIFYRDNLNRLMGRGLGLNATATFNKFGQHGGRRRAPSDSLATQFRHSAADSLVRNRPGRVTAEGSGRTAVRKGRVRPEDDLKEYDLKLDLGETVSKYLKEWNVTGGISLAKATLVTPLFPLKNSVSDFAGSFTNDKISLDRITLQSGDSDITAKGSVSGIRRFLRGRGALDLDLKVTSDVIDADQLLVALDAGSRMNVKKLDGIQDDGAYEKAVLSQGEKLRETADTANMLIVIPSNINAKVLLEAKEVDYTSLKVDWAEADIVVKDRTVQITNTCATSNVGDIYFEGFYTTRSKKDIKAGFYLNLVDITAEKVIDLIPAIDSIVPLLKSFSGMLDCTIAATTSIDDRMNLVIPSMNGVIRIKGTDLEINESQDFYKIAKTLMFKNKRQGHVDKMSVEGYLADSKLEVFPFLLKMDRYKLAISGIQNVDTSFKYHASVLKSPLIFRFGLDLSGNFDKYKLRLGRAKYKKESTMPVFSKVIDQTTVNLSKSINNIFQKGVDKAVAENEKQKALNEFKQATGYVAAVDEPLDSLSEKDLRRMQKAETLSEIGDLDLEKLDTVSFRKLDSAAVATLELAGLVRRDAAGAAQLDTVALKKMLAEQETD